MVSVFPKQTVVPLGKQSQVFFFLCFSMLRPWCISSYSWCSFHVLTEIVPRLAILPYSGPRIMRGTHTLSAMSGTPGPRDGFVKPTIP